MDSYYSQKQKKLFENWVLTASTMIILMNGESYSKLPIIRELLLDNFKVIWRPYEICNYRRWGSFGIHTAFYLLEQEDVESVIGIGRNPLRPEPFSLNIEENSKYKYHAKHITYELDLLLELLVNTNLIVL